jgi:hypothetical protein
LPGVDFRDLTRRQVNDLAGPSQSDGVLGAEREEDRLSVGQREAAQDAYPGVARADGQRGDVADQKLPSRGVRISRPAVCVIARACKYRLSIRSRHSAPLPARSRLSPMSSPTKISSASSPAGYSPFYL